MAKNQHNAGLHYRPLNQLGLSNFNDYIENPIDSRFKFNPPPLKCGKLFGLCKADHQKEKLQKHCPWHPLLKMKAFTFLEISFQKQKSAEESSRKKREESSADFVYRVGSFSAVSFSSAKNISTFF